MALLPNRILTFFGHSKEAEGQLLLGAGEAGEAGGAEGQGE
ncbi:hypothetical protein [Nostoc sp. UHCC 0251]|nr:hypothetical protein [Nostoc sp. UHCC 0251]MEA5623581.1 hypothetical protein [Nostoc sp. UHCC 0251]